MFLGPVVSVLGVAAHPCAGVEGLSLLLAVASVDWENASQSTECARCGLQCQQQ